jgi:hypothetical protein
LESCLQKRNCVSPISFNPQQALSHLWGRPVCNLRTLCSLQGVLLLPFFLQSPLLRQTRPEDIYHGIQVNLHIFCNQFWDALFHHFLENFDPVFNRFQPSTSSIASSEQASTHHPHSVQFPGRATTAFFTLSISSISKTSTGQTS